MLVALRLMLITKSATRITLEPANNEDLEADLEPTMPGRVQPSANMAEGYKLVVQVKLRNCGPWTIKSFKSLLKQGTARRPARLHLDDPGTRYLLVTNADTTGAARDLRVDAIGEWPEEQIFPPSLSATLPHAPGGRIAIWGVLTEHLLDLETKEILGSLLRVPQSRQAECRSKLRDEALQRMRGMSPGVWTREDLASVIRSCGGYLASAPQLELFVPPANYESLWEMLQRRNALVIAGPSGTGKTWAALGLIDQVRQKPSAPEIIEINVNNGPSSTRMLSHATPKLFYVEDPWGSNSLRKDADGWTEQLPRLLHDAHAGHQYIVTSRSDMLSQSMADEKLRRWTVELDADNYREGELTKIYDKRLDQLATYLQAKALEFRTNALEALETPYEVDLFFTHMAEGPEQDEVDTAFFKRILALAHRDAVEDVVVLYLGDSDQTGASAIVWALLAARSRFDRSQLVNLSRKLRTVDRTFIDELEKLVNRLVATRHLRQPGQTVSFSHPSVRAGFEKYVKKNPERSESAWMSLISALTQLSEPERKWGIETAARSIKVIVDLMSCTEFLKVKFEVDSASRAKIDAWLEESLVDPESDFRSVLQLASDVGTQKSIPSELARWFIKGVQRQGQIFIKDWKPPTFDDEWYKRVSADPRSFAIADRFVQEQLPQDPDGFCDDFAIQLDRIASGLTPAFVEAAHKVIGTGFDTNVEAVAAGAVRDLDLYENVLNEALDELASVYQFYEQEGSKQYRAIQDGEWDVADEEGFQIQHEDDGYAAEKFVATYINRIRSLNNWPILAIHPRKSELGRFWAEDISKSSKPPPLEELRAVITVTRSFQDENYAWEAVRKHWKTSLKSDLERRILSNPADHRLRESLIHCTLVASPKTLVLCLKQLTDAPALFVQYLVDMCIVFRRNTEVTHTRHLISILESISATGKEIFQALSIDGESLSPVSRKALSLLDEAAKTASPFVLDKIIPVMIDCGATPSAAIRRWLDETEDFKLAKAAAEAAIRIHDDELAWRALNHKRADARMVALVYLANSLPNPLPQRLLEMSSDPGSRVRRSLVQTVRGRLHRDHQNMLVRLIEDKWSDTDAVYGLSPSYRIAREAIIVLL